MQKCLGIYVENNIIKYAKLSKEKDNIKIESFGIRIYEDLNAEVKKIVEETFSFNTPISVNFEGEKYEYFDILPILSKKDIEKTIKTEFEAFCEEKKYNVNALETRYALTSNIDEKEKIRALNIYINKIELNNQIQPFEKYKIARAIPEAIAIGSIAKLNKKENQLIVNMEETTTITTIIDQQVYKVETLDFGSKEVLDAINRVENSYSKAYDICKNTTIYTAEMEGTEEQPYLQNIMPTLYKIVQKVQEIVNENPTRYQTIYLTGTLASVNNVNLYFQEYLPNVECEILKPKFVGDSNLKINIKEYIEVNSAIALAANGLGEGVQELNFKKASTTDKLIKALNVEMPEKGRGSKLKMALNPRVNLDFKGKLDNVEIITARGIIAVLLLIFVFTLFSILLKNGMLDKQEEIEGYISTQNTEIQEATAVSTSLDSKTEAYNSLISDLEAIEQKQSDIAASRNLIPNLLSQIMYVIPEKVQLISIENAESDDVTIVAQSTEYDQLGYFIASLKTNSILENIVSTSTIKGSNSYIQITIKGDLP